MTGVQTCALPIYHPQADVHILPSSVFWSARSAMRKNKLLKIVRRDMRNTYWAAFKVRGYMSKHALLRVAFLFRQAEMMGALALWTNTRTFLVSETFYQLSDAMLLVAPKLGITTIAYQYSNMANVTPFMMSTVDKCLVFSEMYKKLYQYDGNTLQEYLVTGYLYDGVSSLVHEKSKRHREGMRQSGAEFIVCYFNESVQHDRWGLVSKQDHLGELHALANAVLTDHTFGAVVKSQFMSNTPSQLYPDDELIQNAKKTGRYIELKEGKHRNNIYPTEAALVADLCIGHKFGATAALEAAIAGVRVVLLDAYGTKTLWDPIYAQADIEYQNIEASMEAITYYRTGDTEYQSLGDWTSILHHFDPYRDGKAIERLHKIVENSLSANRATH